MNKYLIVISTPNCPWIKKSEYIRKRILFYHIPILTISKSTSGHTWTHNNCIFQAFLVGREVCFNKWYNVHLLCTGSVLFYFLVFVLLTPQKKYCDKIWLDRTSTQILCHCFTTELCKLKWTIHINTRLRSFLKSVTKFAKIPAFCIST